MLEVGSGGPSGNNPVDENPGGLGSFVSWNRAAELLRGAGETVYEIGRIEKSSA